MIISNNLCVYQKLETLSIWLVCCCSTSQRAMVITRKYYYPNMLPSNETHFCLLSLDYARKMLLVLVKIDKEAYYNLLNEVNVIPHRFIFESNLRVHIDYTLDAVNE